MGTHSLFGISGLCPASASRASGGRAAFSASTSTINKSESDRQEEHMVRMWKDLW